MTLSDFQTPDGWITIAPFDHRGSLLTALQLDVSREEDRKKFQELKRLFMKVLSPHVSAVLTDPEYGLSTLSEKAVDCNVFLSLEASGYTGSYEEMTQLLPDWGIEKIKTLHAGAKLLVYLHPDSSTYEEKLRLIKTVYQQAQRHEVVLLVEPVVYEKGAGKQGSATVAQDWIQRHLEVCARVAPFCHILKIQYPGNKEACDTVSTLHPNWILLSRGISFDTFCMYLTTAARSGCKGYAAGRAVWQEIEQWKTPREWEQFLSTTAVGRLLKLNQILRSSRLLA